MFKQTFQEYKATLGLKVSRSQIKKIKRGSTVMEVKDLIDDSPEYADFLSRIPKAEHLDNG